MNKQKVLSELESFISIQSVSADSKRFSHILKAVSFLKQKLKKLDCDVIISDDTSKPPLIIAIKKIPGAKKTIGIYGHYDVQSEEPVAEWSYKPFKLTKEKGKLYGRGVADNKGHVIQNIAAVEELISTNKLTNNIIFLIEGEEECGSAQFDKLMKKYSKILSKVDVFFVTDVGMHKKNVPQIIYSLRGLAYFELEIVVGETDLHSGVYGNAVYNPVQVISDLFVKMKDVNTGEVHIPRFYDHVIKISNKELNLLKHESLTDVQFQKEMKSYSVTTMRNVPAFLAPKIFPSMDIHGIISGYVGEGPKTIIPKSSTAKFSFRLVASQKVRDIEKKVVSFIKKQLPKGVKYKLKSYSYDDPFYTSIDDIHIQRTAQILSSIFGNKTILMREGGSIPAAEMIQRILKKPVVLTGFILPDSKLHAPDENFDERMFWKGIEALKEIYSNDFS